VAFRATCLRCAIECAVLLRNLRILIKNHLLKQVWHLLFNQSSKPSVFLHILLCLVTSQLLRPFESVVALKLFRCRCIPGVSTP
jgi:hypothetical protein